LREIFTFTLIALSSASTNAALYTFSQDGFSGGGTGGRVIDFSTGAVTTTSNLISVSESAAPIQAAIPIPAAVWLFGTSVEREERD
jgi:predicted ABC-type sugar transport system permease subunit